MDAGKKSERPANPRATANPLSAALFIWTWNVFRKGMHKEMEVEDLFEPLKEHRADLLGDSFERGWNKELSCRKRPSLLRVIAKQFIWEYAAYCFPVVIMELVFRLAQPMFLGQLIRYFEPDSDITLKMAYLNALGLVTCSAVFIFVRQPYMMAIFHLGLKIRVGVCSLIYRKSLRLTQTALGETTVGQVVNLLSNDVSRFETSLIHSQYLWVGPLQAVILTYFMWRSMGVSAVIGVVATLSFIPLQAFIGKKVAGLRMRCALRTDERVRLMNEIISGIQVIKLYTWEIPFAKLVARARLNEIRAIRTASYLRAIMLSFERFTTRLTLFVTILCYVLMGNIVTAEKVFVVASYFGVLRTTMTDFFPRGIFLGAETLVSIKRVEKFLQYEELDTPELPSSRESNSKTGAVSRSDRTSVVVPQTKEEEAAVNNRLEHLAIVVNDATAKWTPESSENTLSDVTLKVSAGQLLAVIGPVGSGKTSLLLTLLRELPLTGGSIAVKGRISYASQEPWLFASSVRNNILFGEPYDRRRYQQVVKACALVRDFELLPYGDRTVVGERGVSLSGGQRARINLARAVYKPADIYILDDPLSAVDAHVGKHLFEDCICGFLRNKARVLVTHQLQFLSHVDHIVILNEGRVEAHGSYAQLQESGLDFAKLLGDQEGDMSGDEGGLEDMGAVLHHSVPRSRRHRDVSIGSSSSSIEVCLGEKMSPEDVQEMRTRGKIEPATYGAYLLASRKYALVAAMLLGTFATQVLSSGSDYWLSFWTNTESRRALAELLANSTQNGTAADSSTNSTYAADEGSGGELMTTELCTYIFSGLTVGCIVMLVYSTFLFFSLCMRSSVNLHNRMFDTIIRLPMRFFNINPSGQILNRFSKDMGAIDEQLPLVLIDCIAIAFLIIGIVTLIATVNYWILLPTVFVVIIFYLFRIIYVHTSRSVKRLEGITNSPVFSHLNASLQGLTTIRAFKAEKILQEEFDRHQDLHSTAFYLFIASSRAFGLWLDFVCLVYITCVTLSFLVLRHDTFGGSVGLAISQSLGLTGTFQWFMRQSAELENQMTAVERVMEYSSLEDEGPLEAPPEKKPPKEWPSHGRIVFKNVYLSYSSDEPPVLKNLNFTINPSEKVGIVGRTGAGKSSLIAALFRLTSVEGSVLIDGVDTKTIGLHDLRTKLSIIPQEPVLFSGSLRKNLDPFDQYSDDVLWNTLDEVELKEVVKDLPAGLNHKMAEGGSNFSVGQRQLVCLARAIVRNNKILVMDEATANVDPRTDAFIQETVRRKFADCTVLTIAHRLLTVMDSDRILVMDAGSAVELDRPHVLLQSQSGFLWGMVQETGRAMAETLARIAEKSYHDKAS
ncbi:probable multidrug resistance-associated protein lethal(2)03659 [Bacillus rossius redtenbacheri]|uniref:probable multidrug resistance-associated protein lethal(2)03659 n=1 Tax=Bacillus rossius redtenbacheri TaxID=93214 RepID=UPI002FDEAFDA